MSLRMHVVLGLLAVAVCVGGCAKPGRMGYEPPPPNFNDAYESFAANFTYMADNALLHDMSINDVHFVPHTDELSGTGVARLLRFAPLLNTYGGTVRYETFEADEDLMARRIEHVREFLAHADCNMDRVEIKPMISGGRGMRADEAIAIMLKGTPDSMEAAMGGNSQSASGGGMSGGGSASGGGSQ